MIATSNISQNWKKKEKPMYPTYEKFQENSNFASIKKLNNFIMQNEIIFWKGKKKEFLQ
jgi:hypothetical protein